jgi:hypothetical protein
LSNNVNFKPEPGLYKLFIRDANGCRFVNEFGEETPIEFTFFKELNQLIINGTGGAFGDELSQPVSCEIDAQDGQINISVSSIDNDGDVPPFNIKWEKQATNGNTSQQRLLFQGVQAGDSLEVYTIKLNEIPITYSTNIENEPINNVVGEFKLAIEQQSNGLFNTEVNPNNELEIIIQTLSGAELTLEIISRNTRLQMIKSTSSVAEWVPLDGTNGNTNYNGFLDLDNLSEGLYRYTITSANQTICDNNIEPNSLQGLITVENENILEIREGSYSR